MLRSMQPLVSPADQVDIHLLRCQQLRLYILKAGRALLSHQDKLRQILSQAAVLDLGPNPSGKAPWPRTCTALGGFPFDKSQSELYFIIRQTSFSRPLCVFFFFLSSRGPGGVLS